MKVIAMRYLVLLLAALSASCTSTLPSLKPYHLDVQQGNVVTSKMMLQLKPGMTKSQVRYVMGTPLLQDSFHQDRWDYLYQMNKGGNVIERRRVILEFKNDGLAAVRGDVIAAGSPGGENAPMATIDEVKTAKSDKTLLAEDAKSSWIDRFKFWKDDEKTEAVKTEAVKTEVVKTEGSVVKQKPVTPTLESVAKADAVVSHAPEIVKPTQAQQPEAKDSSLGQVAIVEATPQQRLTETSPTLGDKAPPQGAMNEAMPVDAKAEITTMVNAWAQAWRTKNVGAYLAFYSDRFVPEGASRKTWLAQRKQRIAGQSGVIQLTLENIKVDLNANSARVEFLQHYSSGKFADHVTKVLSLSREQNQWLIVRESLAAKASKVEANDGAQVVEVFKLRDVTADEKSEAMPEKMMQESARKALEPAVPAKPEPVKAAPAIVPAPKEVKPVTTDLAPAKSEAAKAELNKSKALPPEDAPGYFERMLEKIGF